MSYNKVKSKIEALESEIKRVDATLISLQSSSKPGTDVRVDGEYSIVLDRNAVYCICSEQKSKLKLELEKLIDLDETMAKIYDGLSK